MCNHVWFVKKIIIGKELNAILKCEKCEQNGVGSIPKTNEPIDIKQKVFWKSGWGTVQEI